MFIATINRITKRGSSRLKHALYMAVLCGLRRTGSKKLTAFYEKKMADLDIYHIICTYG
ncbi:hypothetical protein [Paenibacillus anseongense]|uniref:hypothetical protein n=1 Tax=Paenibacillus anseongense TaxID=2682845 RepID=UPI003AEF6C78